MNSIMIYDEHFRFFKICEVFLKKAYGKSRKTEKVRCSF